MTISMLKGDEPIVSTKEFTKEHLLTTETFKNNYYKLYKVTFNLPENEWETAQDSVYQVITKENEMYVYSTKDGKTIFDHIRDAIQKDNLKKNNLTK